MRRLVATTLLIAGGVADAPAQTPFTSVGLGAPVTAIDARAAALGGTGLGLRGGSISARNPADMGFFTEPVMGITYAPESISVKGPAGSLDSGRSRVGLLRGAVPISDWTVGVAFASELDQDWEVEFTDTLSSSLGTFPFTELRTSDGGVSSVNLAVTRRLGRVSLGAEYGILTGNLRRQFIREFEPDTADAGNRIATSSATTSWGYAGSRVRIGVSADVTDRVRVSADLSLQGNLTAKRDSADTIVASRVFAMPTTFEAGASARVTSRLMVTAAGGFTGWAGVLASAPEVVASNTTWFGAGAEFIGTRLLGASLPLRVGFRRTELPFHESGTVRPTETAVTFGLGLRVSDEQARIDVGLEVGSRGDLATSGLEESFQRLSISLSLFQR